MVGVVTNGGEQAAVEYLVNKDATPENLVLRLFKNDITPAEADVVGGYTEATFTGYAAVTLTGASWTITPGSIPQASYAEQAFTSSADQTAQIIYGYYITRATAADLVAAERFTTPPTIQFNGDSIELTPVIKVS